MENRFLLTLDFKLKTTRSISFVQNNVGTSVLEISVVDGGQVTDPATGLLTGGNVIDITGQTISLAFLKPDNTLVIQDETTGVAILDALVGKLECILLSNTLAATGVIKAEVSFSKDGNKLSTTQFNFTVSKSLDNGSGVLSSNQIPIIEAQIEEWQTEFDAGEVIRADMFTASEGERVAEFEVIKAQYAASIADQTSLEVVAARSGEVDLPTKITKMDTTVSSLQAETATQTRAVRLNYGYSRKQALVTFTDDDGMLNVINEIMPLATSKNIPYVLALNNDSPVVGDEYIDQIRDLQNNHRWEMSAHSTSHTNLALYTTEQEITDDILSNKTFLESKGLNIHGIIYPYGGQDGFVHKVCAKYFDYGVRSGGGYNPYPLITMALRRHRLCGTGLPPENDTLEWYKSLIDTAVADKTWLIFITHFEFNTPEQNILIGEVMDYVNSINVPVVNLTEGLDLIGNSLESRNGLRDPITDADKGYFAVDCEGDLYSDKLINVYISPTGLTINSPITAFPFLKISYVYFKSSNLSGFPEGGAGDLTTYRLFRIDENFSYQLFRSYNTGTIYRRSWNVTTSSWNEFIRTAKLTDIPAYATQTSWTGLVAMLTTYKALDTTKCTNFVDFEKVFSTGGTQPILSKTLWGVAEISADSLNPTIIGTAGAINLLAYRDASNIINVKYSASGNNYPTYFKTSFC